MARGKSTVKGKLCTSLLGITLLIEVIAIGVAIGLDVWVKVPTEDNSSVDSSGQQVEAGWWIVGLWKACHVANNKGNTY